MKMAIDYIEKYSSIFSMNLHKSQKALLAAIKNNANASIKELQVATGISSTSVVDYHITKLITKGLLRKRDKWEVIEK